MTGWLRTPPDLTSPPRDELVIKVLVALRVPGVDVHEVIQVHRRYLVELMQQWTRLKEDEEGRVRPPVWPAGGVELRELFPADLGASGGWTRPTAASSAPPSTRRSPLCAPGSKQ